MKKSTWIWAAVLGVVIGFVVWTLFGVSTGHGRSASYAANTAFNLRNAIHSYATEYRRLPGFEPPQSYDVDVQSDDEFMDYLLASERGKRTGCNARSIAFFADKPARKNANGTYIKGIAANGYGGGALWDPWGNHYRIRIDANADGRVADPMTNEPIEASVLIWSAGKDGKFEIWKDNPKTW